MCLHTSAARKPQSTHITFEACLSQYESTSSNGYFGKHINHTMTHVSFFLVTFGCFQSVGAHNLYVPSNYQIEKTLLNEFTV